MNAERLLAHYEQVVDAPDAIARLRRFILDLAVRGKLVPQDAGDELASDLLKRAEREKTKLEKAGKIRKPKLSEPIRGDELPIDLPKNWAWARLCDIGSLSGGMTPSMNRPDFWNGDIVWLSPKDIKTDEVVDSELKISKIGLAETRLELYRPGCLFIVARSGILKRTFPVSINRAPAAANQDMKVLVPFLDGQERYLQIMFRGLTDFLLRKLVKTGTTVQSLKYAEFEQQPFPIPPLSEQHRIVTKVDELMSLCDRLEAAQRDREAVRNRLAAASLARLNASETAVPTADASASNPRFNASVRATSRTADAPPAPEASYTFAGHARVVLDTLPAITARPDQIKVFRQTILNLAVRGMLVPQDTRDEPALDHLLGLAEIPAKARKQLKPLNPADCGGGLPQSWIWLPLGAIIRSMDAGWSPQCESHPRSSELEWGILKTTAVQALAFQPSQHKLLSAKLKPRPHIQAEIGDVLVTRAGPKNRVGVACVVDVPCPRLMISDKIIRFHPFGNLLPSYVALTLNSGFTLSQIEAAKSGMAVMQMNISQDKLQAIAIPLPPVAEQHRIIAKVDALMALCDRLEASLTAAADTRRRLLDALLAEALALDEDRLLEAAE